MRDRNGGELTLITGNFNVGIDSDQVQAWREVFKYVQRGRNRRGRDKEGRERTFTPYVRRAKILAVWGRERAGGREVNRLVGR